MTYESHVYGGHSRNSFITNDIFDQYDRGWNTAWPDIMKEYISYTGDLDINCWICWVLELKFLIHLQNWRAGNG